MLRRVLIGTPAYGWCADVRYIDSLAGTIRLCQESGVHLRSFFIAADSIIQNARNDILNAAVKNNYDDLVFIDSDQDWEPEAFLKLLSYPVDVVGAPVRRRADDPVTFNVKARGAPDSLSIDKNTGLMTAPDMTVGTGFLRLTKPAMQAIWNASPEYRVAMKEGVSRWVFDIRPVNGELVSEDVRFCEQLRELGFPTWIDPTMIVGHCEGNKRYVGNFMAVVEGMKPKLHVVSDSAA